jgi:hypothetical protein
MDKVRRELDSDIVVLLDHIRIERKTIDRYNFAVRLWDCPDSNLVGFRMTKTRHFGNGYDWGRTWSRRAGC